MGQVDLGVPRSRRSGTATEPTKSAPAPASSAGPGTATPRATPVAAPSPCAMSSQAKAALRLSTVMLSPTQLAQRSDTAGSAIARRPRGKSRPSVTRLAAAPAMATQRSASATAGRGALVPSPAQSGRKSRSAPHPSASGAPAGARHPCPGRKLAAAGKEREAQREAGLVGKETGPDGGRRQRGKARQLRPGGRELLGQLVRHRRAHSTGICSKVRQRDPVGRAAHPGIRSRRGELPSGIARLRRAGRLRELRRALHAHGDRPDPLRSLPGSPAARAALRAGGSRSGGISPRARAGRGPLLPFLAGGGRGVAAGRVEAPAPLRGRCGGGGALRRRSRPAGRGA